MEKEIISAARVYYCYKLRNRNVDTEILILNIRLLRDKWEIHARHKIGATLTNFSCNFRNGVSKKCSESI